MRNKLLLPNMEEDQEIVESSPLMDELESQRAPATPMPDYMDQASMVEDEMDNSAELEAETADLMQAQEPSKLEKYSNLLQRFSPKQRDPNELKELQKSVADRESTLDWFRIADKVAQAYGGRHGGKVAGMGDFYDSLSKQNKQRIDNYQAQLKDDATQMELQNEAELNDPDSDISKFMKAQALAYAKRPGSNFDPQSIAALEKMTAKQLSKLGFKSPAMMGGAAKLRFERIMGDDGLVKTIAVDERTGEMVKEIGVSGFAPQIRTEGEDGELIVANANSTQGTRFITGPNIGKSTSVRSNIGSSANQTTNQSTENTESAAPQEVTEYDLEKAIPVNKFKDFKATRDTFDQQVKDDKIASAKIDGVVAMLQEAQKNPAAAGAASASVARLFEKGVMTDEDVKRYAIRHGILNKMEDLFNRFTEGTFSPELAKDVSSSIKTFQGAINDSLNKQAETYAKRIHGSISPQVREQFPVESLSKMIYSDYVAAKKKKEAPGKTLNAGEVERQTSDGRIAIFDEKTKKFLRYKDGK